MSFSYVQWKKKQNGEPITFLCHKLLGEERNKDFSDPKDSEDFGQ